MGRRQLPPSWPGLSRPPTRCRFARAMRHGPTPSAFPFSRHGVGGRDKPGHDGGEGRVQGIGRRRDTARRPGTAAMRWVAGRPHRHGRACPGHPRGAAPHGRCGTARRPRQAPSHGTAWVAGTSPAMTGEGVSQGIGRRRDTARRPGTAAMRWVAVSSHRHGRACPGHPRGAASHERCGTARRPRHAPSSGAAWVAGTSPAMTGERRARGIGRGRDAARRPGTAPIDGPPSAPTVMAGRVPATHAVPLRTGDAARPDALGMPRPPARRGWPGQARP